MDAQELNLVQVKWRKGSRSSAEGSCVEVARHRPGTVVVRDSKDPSGPVLLLTPADWHLFTAEVRTGKHDLL